MADNLNISPDMINNLVNILKNNGFNDQSNPSDTQYSNTSNTKYNTNSSVNQNSQSESNSSTGDVQSNANSDSSINIDFETILKMKSMMETLNNSNDQDSKLLYSLKPYLRKSRQAKLDQYINILKITQVSKLFGSKSEK